MRPVVGVAAAVVVGAQCIVVDRTLADVPFWGGEDARYLFLADIDLWRHGAFAHSGVLWAPRGFDREGFTLKLMFSAGAYHYVSGALGNRDVTGRQLSATVMPGWRFTIGRWYFAVYSGLDLQDHRLSPDDPSAGLRGSMAGLRAGLEFWYTPTATTMVAGDAWVSTIGSSYSARGAFGWRMFERFYFGPEVRGFAADDNYRQFRVGLHVTGLKIKPYEWTFGAGWARDTDDRSSLYGRAGLLARY